MEAHGIEPYSPVFQTGAITRLAQPPNSFQRTKRKTPSGFRRKGLPKSCLTARSRQTPSDADYSGTNPNSCCLERDCNMTASFHFPHAYYTTLRSPSATISKNNYTHPRVVGLVGVEPTTLGLGNLCAVHCATAPTTLHHHYTTKIKNYFHYRQLSPQKDRQGLCLSASSSGRDSYSLDQPTE